MSDTGSEAGSDTGSEAGSEASGYRPATSDEAVQRRTGRDWAEWFAALDAHDANRMDHKGIVALLREELGLQHGWWQQNVAVEYEKARGLRQAVGSTADRGVQLGVQRTLPVPAERAWRWLLHRTEAWLGQAGPLPLTEGARLQGADGSEVEVRRVRDGERLRLNWRPAGREEDTTLQVTVTPKGTDRCTVQFHLERLRDLPERDAMRDRLSAWIATVTKEATP